MTPETPLPEVAQMLPPETAALLMNLHTEQQILILTLIRNVIVGWEQSGVDLDPITFSMVLTPVVATIAGTITGALKIIEGKQQ